ncbi:MAG: hypothetical protein BMS9Abin04_468 [Planctomycetia bacterium]|nr:MAG: hypothetical protein BMS9Abin04_468 [Planctomycetia bacterium]
MRQRVPRFGLLPIALVSISTAAASTATAAAERITIAENGAASAVVVVAADATPPQRHAASELVDFLARVTGAKFRTAYERNPATANLLVGPKAAQWADPGFSTDGLATEGLVLQTVGKDLILAGGEPRGTLYAVYTFLEDYVGCRWWTPTASTIPRRPTLRVGPLDVRYTPALEYRETDAFGAVEADWSARNKYNGHSHHLGVRHGGKYTFEPGFCHTFYSLISPDRYFAEHPEWFSMIDGQRTTTAPHYPLASLCLTNEQMRRELVKNLKQALREAPAEAAYAGLSEVRFYLPGGQTFIGDPGPGRGWDTSASIDITASSQHRSRPAVRAIDGSGLNAETGRLHGIGPDTEMFLTNHRRFSAAAPAQAGSIPGAHWIAFEFDRVYPLGEMWIWNYNENRFHTQGMRRVTIRCSATGGRDPAEWTTVFTGELPQAAGLPDQPHHAAIDFHGQRVRHVVITVHDNWSSAGQTFIAEVSQPDDAGPPERCACPSCRAVEEQEGSAAGLLVRLVNAVAADLASEFPAVPVSTLAYHYTQKPPKITRPRPDVIIRLCSIKCSFSVPMTADRNARFREDVIGWSKICQRLHIWDYVANFSYALNPHPNLRVLGPNLRFLVDHGVTGYFAEALPHSPGMEMAELRSWLLAKLMWNPRLDGRALVEEFVNGYHGPAGTGVLAYLDLMHDAVAESGDYLGLSSPPDAKFLSLENLCQGWRHLLDAQKAVAADETLRLRVQVAQLPVMYVFLMRWNELRKEARTAQIDWPMPDSAAALHKRICQIAEQANMNLKGIPSPIPF